MRRHAGRGFEPASFDAVVALYTLIHLPPAELGDVLHRACDWLVPGGRLLATFGTTMGCSRA